MIEDRAFPDPAMDKAGTTEISITIDIDEYMFMKVLHDFESVPAKTQLAIMRHLGLQMVEVIRSLDY